MKVVNFADGFSSVAPPAIDDYVDQVELDAHTTNTSNPHSVTKTQVGLSNVPNVDATDPANILQTATYRFVSDTEKATWNGKENAIVIGTTAQYWRGDKTWQTLDKSAVGLSNVPNVDSTNPANITQSASYRFVTDAEKALWNGGGIFKDTYANVLTWVATATNGTFAFSTDTKIMYYAVDGALQEVALMKTISGTISNAQISVGTSAVRATVSGSAPSASRKRLIIQPESTTGTIYLGGSTVTVGSGLQIIGPDRLMLDWDASDYYLISSDPGNTVTIIEVV